MKWSEIEDCVTFQNFTHQLQTKYLLYVSMDRCGGTNSANLVVLKSRVSGVPKDFSKKLCRKKGANINSTRLEEDARAKANPRNSQKTGRGVKTAPVC